MITAYGLSLVLDWIAAADSSRLAELRDGLSDAYRSHTEVRQAMTRRTGELARRAR